MNGDLDSSRGKSPKVEAPGYGGLLEYQLFPESSTQILIRVENVADLFDGEEGSEQQFDIMLLAREIYQSSNPNVRNFDVSITERNLSNDRDYDEMRREKHAWRTVDGPINKQYGEDQVASAIVELQAQRIRLFRVSYTCREGC